MYKLFGFVIVFFVTTNLYSQNDTNKVAFVSNWSVGDIYYFKITQINQHWTDNSLTNDQKQEYIAKFSVIDSTENSYTINWSYEKNIGEAYNIPENLRNKFSKYNLTEIKYKTSEVGTFIEILNWKEIGESMNNMFDDLIEIPDVKDEKKKKALETSLNRLRQIYSSKQGIEQLAFKEIQIFHMPLGIEFDINEPLFYDEELPNIFGGYPIKAKAKIYFEEVDFDENFCIFKQDLNLDPIDTRRIFMQIFETMNFNDKYMENALNESFFDVNDHNTFEYYYNPGVPHRIETIRESVIEIDKKKEKKIEKTIIELIYDE